MPHLPPVDHVQLLHHRVRGVGRGERDKPKAAGATSLAVAHHHLSARGGGVWARPRTLRPLPAPPHRLHDLPIFAKVLPQLVCGQGGRRWVERRARKALRSLVGARAPSLVSQDSPPRNSLQPVGLRTR